MRSILIMRGIRHTASMNLFQKVNEASQLSGRMRSQPEDFRVDEQQAFKASGQGEHVWLHLRKVGANTDWLAGQLAKMAGVPRRDVSYAGMKDRNAVTSQWFSVQMPGREAPDWSATLPDGVELLDEKRHDRKLRRGALQGNRFEIVLRDFKGEQGELNEALARIRSQGVPNYFGEQRFGYQQSNIEKARQWFAGEFKIKDRNKRSIYLSAARSWLFNHLLSERVIAGTWNQAVEGDVFMLNGTKSCFHEPLDEALSERVQQQDLHLTGPLWGRGRLISQQDVADWEQSIADEFSDLAEGLERNGLKQERKSLRLLVKDLNYTWQQDDTVSVTLTFSLPAGAYATTVLSEIGTFE